MVVLEKRAADCSAAESELTRLREAVSLQQDRVRQLTNVLSIKETELHASKAAAGDFEAEYREERARREQLEREIQARNETLGLSNDLLATVQTGLNSML